MTETFVLTRTESSAAGTFGNLADDMGNVICVTVERPWADNRPNVSCIPVGTYPVISYDSPRHGQVWMLQDVPNRFDCEIHAANTPGELEGCIGAGDRFGFINGIKGVLDSKLTLNALRGELPSTFTLIIQENYADNTKLN